MPGARKFWRFVGLLPDSHAHQIMAMVAAAKGYVEEFLPANTGPEDPEGQPTSARSPKEFLAAYITEHPTFKLTDLVAAGVREGLGKSSLQASAYALKGAGVLHSTGRGHFAVVQTPHHTRNGAAVKNGAAKKKGKRLTRGTAEAAVLARLAQGGPVSIDTLRQVIIGVGGSAKSSSSMLARLVKTHRVKHAEEKGHYTAA